MSFTRSDSNFPWALRPGCRSGPVASTWSFPEPAIGGKRDAERLPNVLPSCARSVASASSDARMERVVPRPPPVTRRPGSTACSSRMSNVPRSAEACSAMGPTLVLRTTLAGTRRSAVPVRVSRVFPPPRRSAVSARSLAGPSVSSWARFTWRSSRWPFSTLAARTSPRACSASWAVPARPRRSARARSPSRPPSPDSSSGTESVHAGVSARPTAGGTSRRSIRACCTLPCCVAEPWRMSPARPRSTAASSPLPSLFPRALSCRGPSRSPETALRPSRWPSNAPLGPA